MSNDPSRPDHAVSRQVARAVFWNRVRANPLYDPASRAVHQFWQIGVGVLVAALIATKGESWPWLAALIAGGSAAVGSVAVSIATWKVPAQRSKINDLLRYVRTFGTGLLGTWTAASTVTSFDWQSALLAAVVAVAGSMFKTGFVNGNASYRELLQPFAQD